MSGTNLGTVGFNRTRIQTKTSAYTFVPATDNGGLLLVNVSSTVAVTLPNNGTPGDYGSLMQTGSARVTLAAASGGTLQSPHTFLGTYQIYSVITWICIANVGGSAAVWVFGGDGS